MVSRSVKLAVCGMAVIASLLVSQSPHGAYSVPVISGQVHLVGVVDADSKKPRKPHPLLDCIPGRQGTEREYSECP